MRQAHSQKLHLILWMEFHLRNQKAGSENSDTLPNTLELVALTPVWFRASVLQRIQEQTLLLFSHFSHIWNSAMLPLLCLLNSRFQWPAAWTTP
jgi:hypothetical protein